MLALAGYPLGVRCVFVDPSPKAPAGQCAEQVVAHFGDPKAIDRLKRFDRVTFEFENVPVEAVVALARHTTVLPPPSVLAIARDRLEEKTLFQQLGIPTTSFHPVNSEADLREGLALMGTPCVLKTRRLGYDGKGQVVVRDMSEAAAAQAWAGMRGQPALLERWVPFDRELSIIAVRSLRGQVAFYPVVENQHQEGILRSSRAPAPGLTPELQGAAEALAQKLLEHFSYVGVMALELFQQGGTLLANELAPRVHNSGHWTIEGARTSQFENHLRAVLDLPLGSTEALGVSAMLNILGSIPELERILTIPDAHLHDYGKQARPGRKVGHITLRALDPAVLEQRIAVARGCLDDSSDI